MFGVIICLQISQLGIWNKMYEKTMQVRLEKNILNIQHMHKYYLILVIGITDNIYNYFPLARYMGQVS